MDMLAVVSVVVCACWDMRVLYLRGLSVLSRGMLEFRTLILYVSMAMLLWRARYHDYNDYSLCMPLCMILDQQPMAQLFARVVLPLR
jgi:hypothetical protein